MPDHLTLAADRIADNARRHATEKGWCIDCGVHRVMHDEDLCPVCEPTPPRQVAS